MVVYCSCKFIDRKGFCLFVCEL